VIPLQLQKEIVWFLKYSLKGRVTLVLRKMPDISLRF